MTRFKSIFVAAFAVLVAASAYAAPAYAQSSASLSIVPKKNYTIEPGKSVNDKLTIRNLDSERTLELNLRVVDFTFKDDGGTPQLMLAEDAPQTSWSLKPYLTLPKTVSIGPNSSKTVDMAVKVPANGGAGSYYSAIVYSSGPPEGGNVGLSASGVTLVFAAIPGQVKEDLKLEKFGAYNLATASKKAGYTSFTTEQPQNIAYTLKNNGNVVESPVGSIVIKDLFGKERTITDVNPNASLALIGQTRTYTSCIKLKEDNVEFEGSKSQAKSCTEAGLWPGRYTSTLNLFYGQNGNRTQEITSTASFWYLPVWFIAVLAVLLVAIALGIWRLVIIIRQKMYGPRTKKPTRRK